MVFTTIPEMFLYVTERYEHLSKPAFMRKVSGAYANISYRELRETVEAFAIGLQELGVKPGERVGIVSENRIEWVIADFALAGIGVVDVPIFPTLTAKQEASIFGHCAASVIIVSNTFQLNKILKVREEMPSLRSIIVMNDDVAIASPNIYRFSDILASGRAALPAFERHAAFQKSAAAIKPDDLLTLIYTSGTTGEPKGVMLTHKNVIANIHGAAAAIPITKKDVILCYLPLCHCYERTTGYYTVFSCGATIAFAESIETVAENLKEVRPTIMTSVPRLFERIRNRILTSMENEPRWKQKLFRWAIDIGKYYLRLKDEGKLYAGIKLKYAIADRLVFSKIRERTGGRLRGFVSGGAALSREIGEFFLAIGITIIEGYGLSEAGPVLAVNRFGFLELGTVGKPLYNVQLRIADDGEILAKGENIMAGYYHNEQATREAIDDGGWLHTGDIGCINKRGNLVITDRKKSILISSGGKNIAPQPVENALLQSRYIDQIILIGDQREYCTALIVPDLDVVKALARNTSLSLLQDEELIAHPDILRKIQHDIDVLQKDFSKYEKVRRFALLEQPFTIEGGDMTPTLKVRRHIVEQKYKEIIEKMYSAA